MEAQRAGYYAAKPLRSLRRCGEKTTEFRRYGGIQERGDEETTNEEIQRENRALRNRCDRCAAAVKNHRVSEARRNTGERKRGNTEKEQGRCETAATFLSLSKDATVKKAEEKKSLCDSFADLAHAAVNAFPYFGSAK